MSSQTQACTPIISASLLHDGDRKQKLIGQLTWCHRGEQLGTLTQNKKGGKGCHLKKSSDLHTCTADTRAQLTHVHSCSHMD